MLNWTLVGLIAGFFVGYTGAGGSFIAVPLLSGLVGLSVHDATTASSLVVALGASLNWIAQRKLTDYPVALSLAAFSMIASIPTSQIKPWVPDSAIRILFSLAGAYTLYLFWSSKESTSKKAFARSRLWLAARVGFVLGIVITLSGIGGGALLVPILAAHFGLNSDRATATSLLTIVLSASVSLAAQAFAHATPGLWEPTALIALAAGSLISAVATRAVASRIPEPFRSRSRMALIAIVIVVSISLIWIRQ